MLLLHLTLLLLSVWMWTQDGCATGLDHKVLLVPIPLGSTSNPTPSNEGANSGAITTAFSLKALNSSNAYFHFSQQNVGTSYESLGFLAIGLCLFLLLKWTPFLIYKGTQLLY